MPVDTQRLQWLRDRQRQAMSADDSTIMTDGEVDELVTMERQDAAEKEEIRATARREAEQRKAEAEQQQRRNANALPYRRPPSLPGRGLDLIKSGLDHA
ncbi:conserved protein of unknown function [Magnetospirillum sp. XM-1]|uniref:hypothetical protein n=1 Tax=Magnetospirillum sp. XM-1 TaxID=1663591 RepID=UPI00073DD867|nr:hypothetical protein [Magnetospirillum sp. XM-1]CUW39787.1 conserved protein of unknown function [Magnetospirillum sp. XM-1]